MTVPHALSWGITLLYTASVRPKTTPPLIASSVILIFAADLAVVLNEDQRPALQTVAWALSTAAAGLAIVVIGIMPMRHPGLSAEAVSKPFTAPTSALRSPEDNLTLWQWMTVTWMKPMIAEGTARQLQFEDVWSLAYEFDHSRLHEAFRLLKGSVFRRLVVANGVDLLITPVLGLIETFGSFGPPVLLQFLLQSMENPESSVRAPIFWAVATLLLQLLVMQANVLNMWYCRRVYERSRGELITMLYEKTLNRKIIGETVGVGKGKDQNSASTGKVLNIMRGDAYEVAQRFWEWPDLFTKPLAVVVSIALVWRLLGWSCMLGIGVFVLFQGFTAVLTRALLAIEKERRVATDDKLKVITQFIETIRHLRYYSWEGKWLGSILAARQKELNIRAKSGIYVVVLTFSNSLASGLFPVFSFLGFTLIAKQELRIDIAFSALQLFGMVADSLTMIPNLITTLINARVSFGRIETFMKEPDRETGVMSDDDETLSEPEEISLEEASFAWPGLDKAVLKEINFTIPPGVTVVHGKVGSGKTALLQALLGELDLIAGGYVPPNAMIAYCSQIPWLQNMSIRENITFGYPFDRDRYAKVLAACALTTDLASFKNGDLSFIGENGIGLSGGQKARVALARAVYSSAPYLFLDDPISALDQQTAEHVVRECIAGSLCKGRSIILVTHRLDLVRGLADKVIDVVDGHATITDADLIDLEDEEADENDEEGALNGKANGSAPGEDGKGKDAEAEAIKDDFIEEEHRAHGSVKLGVYREYIKAGKMFWWAVLIFLMILSRIAGQGTGWLLKSWGEGYQRVAAAATELISDPFKKLPPPDVDIKPWLVYFALLTLGMHFCYALFRAVMVVITYTIGKTMFEGIMKRISNASFRFYDVTPVGRLMNRMTSDIGTIDGPISNMMFVLGFCALGWATAVLTISLVSPGFFVLAMLVTVGFVLLFKAFLPTSQNLRRLEMVSLSPLMANFGTLIEGLATVRAFRAQRRFQAGVIRVVDTFQKMDHFYWSLQAWLSIRVETLSAASTLVMTLWALYTNTSPGLTAFVLTAAGQFVRNTHNMCRTYGQLELDFTSVERVVELLHIEQEPEGERSAPPGWPSSGELAFNSVNIRYARHLDLVLKDINLRIAGGSNVAVVGRTGSGKSTLALALLATVRPSSGTITLDGIDISTLPPSELRRHITFLAQEPTLFVGSMRANLDPLDQFPDAQRAAVLSRLGGARHGWTLESPVEVGGKNLSQGQRQLVQLARAILRRSPLVILDEATASIDLGTSLEVQDILRQEMGGSTVVTIAHRVEAVAGADWFIRLAEGRVVEQGKVEEGAVSLGTGVEGGSGSGSGAGSSGE